MNIQQIRETLLKAEQFIVNGAELGFIKMPDAGCPDPAHDTLPAIRAALTSLPVRSEAEWMDQFDLLHPASVRYRCTWANGEKGYEPGYFDQWHGYLGALRSLGLVAATRDA